MFAEHDQVMIMMITMTMMSLMMMMMTSDEMAGVVKLTQEPQQEQPQEQQGGDWQEVAARGRSQVTRRVSPYLWYLYDDTFRGQGTFMFNLIVIPLLVAGDRPEHRGDSPAAAGPGSVQVLGQY